MISAKAIWTDNERYLAEATSRHALVMDTASEMTANTPMELVLIALCGCTASDVVGILKKKREPFTSLEVSAEGERAHGYPAVYTEIKLRYRVGGNVSPQSNGRCRPPLQRKILLSLRHAGENRENRSTNRIPELC